jgi:AbrB family looped-hinge helix DNA binding protein
MIVTTRISDGRIYIPAEVRRAADLKDGQQLEVEITAVGILLRTPKPIDPSQAWFWTPEWQAGEREADGEIAAGRGTFYEDDEAFLASLEEAALGDADL